MGVQGVAGGWGLRVPAKLPPWGDTVGWAGGGFGV